MTSKYFTAVFICMTFLSVFPCSGQELQAGLIFGAGVAKQKGYSELSEGFRERLVPYFGISLGKSLSRYFSLKTEINYSLEGGKRTGIQPIDHNLINPRAGFPDTILYASFKNEIKLSYIEMPLLLQFSIDKDEIHSRVFYHLTFGPFLALRIKAKRVTSGSGRIYVDSRGTSPLTLKDGAELPAQSFESVNNIGEEVKRLNAGIITGLGIGYKYFEHKFFAEARFVKGLINIQSRPDQSGRSKTASLLFSAGYIYHFQLRR